MPVPIFAPNEIECRVMPSRAAISVTDHITARGGGAAGGAGEGRYGGGAVVNRERGHSSTWSTVKRKSNLLPAFRAAARA